MAKQKIPHKKENSPSLLSKFFLALYALFLTSVLFTLFSTYPIPGILGRSFALLSTLSFFIAVGMFGAELGDWLGWFAHLKKKDGLWKGLYSIGLGAGVVGLVIFLVGWIGPFRINQSLYVIAFLLFGFPIFRIKKLKRIVSSIPGSFHSQFSTVEGILIVLIMAGLVPSFLSCFSPITYYDSLTYHLALPSLYLQKGAIQSISNNLYSHFPALSEMLFMFFLNQFSEPESVINLFLWGLSLGVSLGIGTWVTERSNRTFGLLAMVLWWLMPAVQLLSIGAYVEIPLAFFSFLAIRSFLVAKEKKWNIKILALSGVFCGFACSVKYTGAMTPIVLSLAFLFWGATSLKIFFKRNITFWIAVLAPFSVWLLKNAVEVGNPVFPFLYDFLGGHVDWTRESAASYFRMLTEYDHQSVLLFQVLLSPWNLISKTLEFGGGFDVLGDFGWPLLVALFPLGFFFWKKEKHLGFLSCYLILHFVGWLLGKPVLRFLMGGLPIFVLVGTLSLYRLAEQNRGYFKALLCFFVAPLLLSNQFMYYFLNQDLQLFSVSLGLESRHSYLSRRLNYYPLFSKINFSLGNKEKVLILGEQRTYHLKVPHLSSPLFAPSAVSKWANKSSSNQELLQHFLDEKITFLLINEPELKRLGGLEKFGFEEQGQNRLKSFISEETNQIPTENSIQLYQLSKGPA